MKVYVLQYSYEQWLEKNRDRWDWRGSVHNSLESAQKRAAEDAQQSLEWKQQEPLMCGDNWTAYIHDKIGRVYRVVEVELQD